MDVNIDIEVFENCGQELYDDSLETEYHNIEQKKLMSSLIHLQEELTIIDNDIYELTKSLTELNTNYNCHNTFTSNTFSFLFITGYNGTLYQIQNKINEIKEELNKKNRERSIILNDINIIRSQLIHD